MAIVTIKKERPSTFRENVDESFKVKAVPCNWWRERSYFISTEQCKLAGVHIPKNFYFKGVYFFESSLNFH